MSVAIDISATVGDFKLATEFDIADGTVTAVFGPSGAGKTTLLRCIAGLLPSAGRICVGNTCWQDDTGQLAAHERDIGFVFQKANLFQHLSVADNLHYGLTRTPVDKRRVHFEQLVRMLELGPLLKRLPHTLSGGEQQRVAIGRALLRSPGLLALDEPLAGLDQARKNDILALLRMLQAELAIPMLYVSHSIDEVARIADDLVLLEAGQVRARGEIRQMLTRLDLPLAKDIAGGAVIESRIAGHDTEFFLTRAEFDGGMLQLPGDLGGVGQSLRLVVLARDVSLALHEPTGTSILNILEAQVDAIETDGEAQVIVKLIVGNTELLARITRKSLTDLNLTTGTKVFAQVKTVALIG
jgi:molybdate transport system ATP-binding protein